MTMFRHITNHGYLRFIYRLSVCIGDLQLPAVNPVDPDWAADTLVHYLV